MNKPKPVGAFWKKLSKNGKKLLSGKIEQDLPAGTKIVMWENGFKETDRHPDFLAYIDTYVAKPSNNDDIPL